MQITIDTKKDSSAEIKKVIALLEQLLPREEKEVAATPIMSLGEEKAEENLKEIDEVEELSLSGQQETPPKPTTTNIFQTFKDSTRNAAPGPKGFFDITAADVPEKKSVNNEKKQDPLVSIYEIDD